MIRESAAHTRSIANPYSNYSESRLFDKIDADFLRVCKQCFITGLALKSGPVDEAIEKYKSYQTALNEYVMMTLEELYLPLEKKLHPDSKPAEFMQLKIQNGILNKRLRRFMQHSAAEIENHRIIFSNAITRIDKLVTQHHIKERCVLYPLHASLDAI